MSDNKSKTILVIEDERPLLNVIEKKLESKNFNVLTSRTAEDAIEELDGGDVDAIWLDHYLLGGESGFDFFTHLKEKGGRAEDIPVFLVSNTASPDKIQSYMKLGVDKYYTKADNSLADIVDVISETLEEK